MGLLDRFDRQGQEAMEEVNRKTKADTPYMTPGARSWMKWEAIAVAVFAVAVLVGALLL